MEKQSDSEALLKAIQDRAEQDRQEVLAQGRDYVTNIATQTDMAVDKINADGQRQAEQAIGRERDRLLGKAQADRRLALLGAKQRLLHDAFAQAEKEILAVSQSDSYREILGALISEAIDVTGPDSQMAVAGSEVLLCQSLIMEKGIAGTVASTQERAGTIRLTSADGQRRVDNSLHTRLARAQIHHQPEVARILFQERIDTTGKHA